MFVAEIYNQLNEEEKMGVETLFTSNAFKKLVVAHCQIFNDKLINLDPFQVDEKKYILEARTIKASLDTWRNFGAFINQLIDAKKAERETQS